LRDTVDWLRTGEFNVDDSMNRPRLSYAREMELLRLWHARS
jgi:hypothetical protein